MEIKVGFSIFYSGIIVTLQKINMDTTLILPAFIAGLVSFLMPCTFPLVPSFLAFVAGTTKEDRGLNPKKFVVIRNAVAFVVGFAVVFVFFGVITGLVGNTFGEYKQVLNKISGLMIVLFGIVLLDLTRFKFLNRSRGIKLPTTLKPGRVGSSMLIGVGLGFGWTPCVGPLLGSILLLASSSDTIFEGGFLLSIFSLGLGLPFILLAILGEKYISLIRKHNNFLSYMNKIGGLFLILIGTLQFFDKMGIISKFAFDIGEYISYSKLIDYL